MTADVIVPVPDSGVPAAMGFAAESGIPYELGIIRNHYVGRTFIQPKQEIRALGVRLKHSANRDVLEGQARGAGGRFHRARDDLAEDRADGARSGRQGSALPQRLAADQASRTSTASTCRARPADGRADDAWRKCASRSAWTRSASSRSRGSMGDGRSKARRRSTRNSPTTPSPAIIRRRSLDHSSDRAAKDFQLSLLAEHAAE